MFQPIRSNRGQASVMIGMMMLTFLLFFTFVVNTGMLVQAKINLQNAADLAAYAGAATQARQLNNISYLNYEMRRQYKKFLFRYYVMGNVAQKGFPTAPGGPTAYNWSPDNNPADAYNVPAVCLIFNANDNYCQLTKLPPINQTPNNGMDLINSTLNQQLAALESIRQLNCGRIAQSNLDVLLLWLYNTDPDLSSFTLSDPSAQGIITVTKAVAQGLGLVPREIILNERIKTLEGYVNALPQTGVTVSSAQGLKTASDPNANERTIQAFYSAYYTLGPNVFDDQYVQMDELMPAAGSQANLLALKQVQGNFDAYAVGYTKDSDGTCAATMVPATVRLVPLGVQKDPTVLTYYAVRLKAQAKILFSPFGPMNIKAYAAARPFGSRIGPPLSGDDAAVSYPGQAAGLTTAFNALAGNIPNLPVAAGDSTASGKGWDTTLVLGTLYQAMFGGAAAAAGGNQTIGQSNAEAGYQAAMAPNPYEGNLYNIMNDKVNDPFVVNFDTNHQIKFWAPVFPLGQQATLQQDLKSALQAIFTAPNTGGVNNTFAPTAAASDAQLQNDLLADMLTYINKLPQEQGENGEGMNIAVLSDPFTGSNGQPLALSPQFMASDPTQYRTSWVTTNNSAYTTTGRVGYSVKFVSFDSLLNPKTITDGTTQFTNVLPVDSEASTDNISEIQH